MKLKKRSRLVIGTTTTLLLGFSSLVTSFAPKIHHGDHHDERTSLDRCKTSCLYSQAPDGEQEPPVDESRRRSLHLLGACCSSFAVPPAFAGIPELDSSGQLYSPKTEMLSGGSTAGRGGIPLTGERVRLREGEALQSIYETRFVAYLTRFLLNFDPAARAWWLKQGFGDSWDQELSSLPQQELQAGFSKEEIAFAEFAESVEVGLADYFSGPFGSYGSISAARAGILASQPAKSVKAPTSETKSLVNRIFRPSSSERSKSVGGGDDFSLAFQGVLNVYTLLKARYTSLAAKRQLAILFSFISIPGLQPVNEIKRLLGEADNCTISSISVIQPESRRREPDSRTSPRRGGGYSLGNFPQVRIDASPPLGDRYLDADLQPIMQPTSRVLSIAVTDGGEGYSSAPQVTVLQSSVQRLCQSAAILGREGRVESIVVLDPGYGYGGRNNEVPPSVKIEAPPRVKGKKPRTAKAVAVMEYEVTGVKVLRGGNGYVSNEPPAVTVTQPEDDPDWFLSIQEQPELRMVPVKDVSNFQVQVSEMLFADGNVAYSTILPTKAPRQVDMALIDRLQRDPLELVPSTIRPALRTELVSGKQLYKIQSLDDLSPAQPTDDPTTSYLAPFYRALDPVFGGVGRVPVSKGAAALSASEYARLALSGAVCTVVVRTALNPLELIKTKQQLRNDKELLSFARKRVASKTAEGGVKGVPRKHNKPSTSFRISNGTSAVSIQEKVEVNVPQIVASDSKKAAKLGTLDLIQSTIELRGWQALFQSADITFLASLVFGSFGFGATELFRRSFGSVFLPQSGAGDTGQEIVLLLAAAVATVVTAAVASPFEVLRVRSMGLVNSESWSSVLQEFLSENSRNESVARDLPDSGKGGDFELRSLKPKDVLPLWSGFAPTISRELPFAVAKFLTFDVLARLMVDFLNAQRGQGALPVQVGVGLVGLSVSAFAGAIAGIAGAIVSHPADLILTKTSASSPSKGTEGSDSRKPDWREVVKELIGQDGGVANLFVGLGARSTFFFLVIGLQFFLYDWVKTLFQVGQDDLSLVLDVFYAVRAGLDGIDY